MSARVAIAAVLAGLIATACAGDDAPVTGVDLEIRFDPALELDRLALWATAGEARVMERTLLPRNGRPLRDTGREGVLILLADELDGERLTIRIDGIRDGDLVAEGTREVTARFDALVNARVDMQAVPDDDDDDDDDSSGPGS